MPEIVDLSSKSALFSDHWTPRIVREVNDNDVKLVKVKGEFVWHRHDREDELFMVIRGSLLIKLRDPELLLLEPRSTLSTGEIRNEQTVDAQWI